MRRRKPRLRILSTLALISFCFSLTMSLNTSATGAVTSSADSELMSREEEPVIVQEDLSLRGKYEKHFLKSDGSYTAATYAVPVHYQDAETGEWNEIDNQLVETTDENDLRVYKNRDGLFDVSFAKTPGVGGVDLVTLESDGHTISWKLLSKTENFIKVKTVENTNNGRMDTAPAEIQAELIEISEPEPVTVWDCEEITAEKAVGALVYNDLAANGVDVRFTVTPLKVKEDFLLDEAPAEVVSYTSLLTLSEGLSPTVLEYGDISISDEEGEEVFCIAAPYMTDAAGESSSDIAVSFEQQGGAWRLTVTPDLNWLQDEARVYPVTVDPTVYPINNAANTKDTYIYEGSTASGAVTRGNLDRMYIGNRNSTEKKCRGLVKFVDMPTINGTITSATLTLTTPSGTSTWQGMHLYRALSDWDTSTVAWPGPSLSLINFACAAGGKYVFGVTEPIQDMYRDNVNGTHNNYGFAIRYMDESVSDYNSICSSEYGTDTQTNTTKPYLVINYNSYSNTPTQGIVSGEYYFIRSAYSEKYMDVTNFGGAGTSVIQCDLNKGANQRWRIVYEGNGLYSLTPAHNQNLRLDVPNAGNTDGLNLQVTTSNNTPAQRWRILANGDSTYRLMPQCGESTKKALDIEGPSKANNAPLQIWSWDSSAPQMRWYLDRVESSTCSRLVTSMPDGGFADRWEAAMEGYNQWKPWELPIRKQMMDIKLGIEAAALAVIQDYPVASTMLLHYLGSGGEDYVLTSSFISDSPDIDSFRVSVKNDLRGSLPILLAKKTSFDYGKKSVEAISEDIPGITDWKLSINKCDLWGYAVVNSSGTATYTLYMRDIYDYEVGKEDEYDTLATVFQIAVNKLAEMPYYGLAKPYKVSGSTTF